MTSPRRGDVVLVRFVFSDESGAKHRPAVVLSTNGYHRGRHEVVVAAITSNTERVLFGDYVLSGWQQAGLLFPSVATAIYRTIKRSMIQRKLGRLLGQDMSAVERGVRAALMP